MLLQLKQWLKHENAAIKCKACSATRVELLEPNSYIDLPCKDMQRPSLSLHFLHVLHSFSSVFISFRLILESVVFFLSGRLSLSSLSPESVPNTVPSLKAGLLIFCRPRSVFKPVNLRCACCDLEGLMAADAYSLSRLSSVNFAPQALQTCRT